MRYVETFWSFYRYRVYLREGAGNFSLHHRILIGYGAHSASYPMGTRG